MRRATAFRSAIVIPSRSRLYLWRTRSPEQPARRTQRKQRSLGAIGILRFGRRALLGYFPQHQRSEQMRVFLAMAVAVSLVTLAHAQSQNVPQYGEEDKPKTQVQKDADTAAERAYQRSLGSIPEKGSNDPWGTVRSNDAPKNSAARTPAAKTKTKAGSASAKAASPN
jgi:hypothetical protein